jgi:asparagine synthase (glutamine-hydrolysing)
MVRWSGLAPGEAGRIAGANRTLAHRGPDSAGLWQDAHCALAFSRLKVIDLSPAGDQPMANEDGSLQIVFNGEIYNFRALRELLQQAGHTFRSKTDTEVILHGYEQWGLEELLPKLRGMFAFALWDAARRRLVLARDPMGVKPLYVAEREDALVFASEPKALFASGLVTPELDAVAMHEALTYRYVPAPRSGFKDVEKLPPGNAAIAELGGLVYRPWWRLTAADGAPGPERIDEALQTSVASRLIADVPLGAWLSGGIDSGLIASFMRERGDVNSFAAGFAQAEWDERDLARASARQLGTKHADFELPADVFRLLPQIVWHCDEPFFDSSCLPTFVLSQETKKHVTVVLSGDGGDEAFAGYERYVGMQQYARWRTWPGFLRAAIVAVLGGRNGTHSRQGWDRIVHWLERCRAMEGQGFHPYIAAMDLFSQEQIRALYADGLTEELDGVDARDYLGGALRRTAQDAGLATGAGLYPATPTVLQRTDWTTYLPGDVLHKVDRMSMAHGLEVRSPFLDCALIPLAAALPDAVKLPGRVTKPVLRQLARNRLPADVLKARKRGFGVPLDDWFRGPLQKMALEVFAQSRLVSSKRFKPRYWDVLWNEHQARRAQHGERLYALLALELWYAQFLSGTPAAERPAPLE